MDVWQCGHGSVEVCMAVYTSGMSVEICSKCGSHPLWKSSILEVRQCKSLRLLASGCEKDWQCEMICPDKSLVVQVWHFGNLEVCTSDSVDTRVAVLKSLSR